MEEAALIKTRRWLENMVIGLGLCPFAGKAYMDKQVGFKAIGYTPEALTEALNEGIKWIMDPAEPISTQLIVISQGLESFHDYLDIYYGIEEELKESGLSEEIQLANFHPEYQFSGIEKDEVENYTNRSPYPVFHLLKVDDVAQAIDRHPDVDGIPQKNIETMKKLGLEGILKLYG